MCGIYCAISKSSSLTKSTAINAIQTMKHRGPDSTGIICLSEHLTPTNEEKCSLILGHLRLSILDLSHSADQPMQHGNYWICFNGEIYNFIEIREELRSIGYNFITDSDTEVALKSYIEWGEDCFKKFNGMWAIAILDKQKQRVVASRDRMGVKPLYFFKNKEKIVFASEIKAIISDETATFSINSNAAFDFLIAGISDHNQKTFYQEINELPPGETWSIDTSTLTIRKKQFHTWQIESNLPTDYKPGELESLIYDSVKLRLRSDAKMVSLLSGGLDSSIITYLCSKHINDNAKRTNFKGAFSYGYLDPAVLDHDETNEAANFMKGLKGLEHIIKRYHHIPNEDEIIELFRIQEQPFPTPSVIASLRIYRAISEQGYKVALTGEGADELFGGYTKQYLPRLAADQLLRGKLMSFIHLIQQPHVSVKGLANKIIWNLPSGILKQALIALRPNYNIIQRSFMLEKSNRFLKHVDYSRLPLADFQRKHILSTNLPMILRFADRNSMAASIEQRLPFMDYRVIQYALNTPADLQYRENLGKYILRKEFSTMLPKSITFAEKSKGFGNAEQFYPRDMITEEALFNPPDFVHEFIDVRKAQLAVQKKSAHTTLWLPVSFLMWAKYASQLK